jgi:hypothetical protein
LRRDVLPGTVARRQIGSDNPAASPDRGKARPRVAKTACTLIRNLR